MGIGTSIFLMVLGAILTFALHWQVAGLDMQIVGWVLMVAGAGGLVLYFYFSSRRRASRTVESVRRVSDDTRPPPV